MRHHLLRDRPDLQEHLEAMARPARPERHHLWLVRQAQPVASAPLVQQAQRLQYKDRQDPLEEMVQPALLAQLQRLLDLQARPAQMAHLAPLVQLERQAQSQAQQDPLVMQERLDPLDLRARHLRSLALLDPLALMEPLARQEPLDRPARPALLEVAEVQLRLKMKARR